MKKAIIKANFLREMAEKFNIKLRKVYQKNIFERKNLTTDVIISRAFKPLPVIFQIAKNNFKILNI